MANTATRADKEKVTRTITFKNKEHEKFYKEYLTKCRYQDVYHKALVYCNGAPGIYNYDDSDTDGQLNEMRCYVNWEDMYAEN